MGDRAAEGGQAELEEGEEDFAGGRPVWSVRAARALASAIDDPSPPRPGGPQRWATIGRGAQSDNSVQRAGVFSGLPGEISRAGVTPKDGKSLGPQVLTNFAAGLDLA